MNLLVSYNWLKEYLETDLSPQEFASRVSLSGPSVERIYEQGVDLDKIVVGKIVNITKHPNADKLRLVEVDIGKKNIQVVCGGSNLQGGMKVAVALPGARVKWHGEGEQVTLKETEIREEKSFGMICASAEIGLNEQFMAKTEREIIDLSDLEAIPGTPLVEALGLKDTIFDIEITTNRPDAMSISGLARECAAILKVSFMPPEINSIKAKKNSGALRIKNESTELCKRYQAVVIEGVKVKDSPWWLKKKLASVGKRSINNVVDITNFVLWEMGQPLHAFDYDKLNGKKITIREARKGEKIRALDGLNYKLKSGMLVIADSDAPIAIAGIMGGEGSGVSENTTTIVLESATFEPVSVRKTSRDLNLRSESSALFEKGLSIEATTPALLRAANLILGTAGGVIKSEIFDLRAEKYEIKEYAIAIEKIKKIMGVEIEEEDMIDILARLGFETRVEDGRIIAKAPFWRDNDIEGGDDLIEEIARIYGYHRLPSILPKGELPAQKPEELLLWEERAKDFAYSAGFTECYSYSFVSKQLLELFGYNPKATVRLQNPLTEDFEYMRPNLLPGLLKIIGENKNNIRNGKIFELSNVYLKGKNGDLPSEVSYFCAALYGESKDGELFYNAKGIASEFLKRSGIFNFSFKESDFQNFHPARQLAVFIDKEEIGVFGEIHPALLKRLGVESRVGFFNFNFESLVKHFRSHKSFSPLPEYPEVKRDVSFIVDRKTEYEAIRAKILSTDALVAEVELFDVYQGYGVPIGKKSMALHIAFRSSHKTLEAKEVERIWEKIVKTLKKELKAEIRS